MIDGLSFLTAERLEKGITQTELANRIGMTQPQIAKIESLDSIPSLSTLKRYAKGLGYDTEVMFLADESTNNKKEVVVDAKSEI